ncbi:MAG: ATP-binding protein [Ktedonobacteraceae bacterium]|nr:ATP-binding protein [Ktedonobacteraceae bacterium]
MTQSPFRTYPFIETAFARRLQAKLHDSWDNRSWHLLVADPGAGKTTAIRDLQKRAGGRSVLAVVAPKNIEDEQALGDQFFSALGVSLKGHWRTRKPKLMGHLHQYGTEFLIVDDAHDLSMPHLMLLKEVTDQGKLQYDHLLGVCLVAAGRGNTIPLKEILDQPEPTWLQWRRRLDSMQPFCRVLSHTSEEVREILATLETVFQPLLPQLNLRRWTSSIYDWLTQAPLDPTRSGRVTMDNLMKLVIAALEWSYEAKATDVQVSFLERAAEWLVLRHDTLWIIDGAAPSVETNQAEIPSPEQADEMQAGQVSSSIEEQKIPPSVSTEQAAHAPSRKKAEVPPATSDKCTFSGVVQVPLKRFEESSVARVECPGCGRVWTLSPSGGVLRFKSHDKRKTNTPNAGRRWARGEGETDWDVVGGD